MRDGKGMDPDGRGGREELEGAEGERTIMKIQLIKKSCFSIK